MPRRDLASLDDRGKKLPIRLSYRSGAGNYSRMEEVDELARKRRAA
jgi:hypothetical protein